MAGGAKRTRRRASQGGRRRGDTDEGTQVVGIHAVETLLTRDPARLQRLYVQREGRNARLDALIRAAEHAGIEVERRARNELDRMVDAVHQGVVADCTPAPIADEAELEWRWASFGPAPLLLALDGVLDPRNLGACLRSAEAAGVDAVLLPRSRRAPLSAVARKAASGAAETLFIVEVANLARRLAWLREGGVRVIGAVADTGRPFTAAPFAEATALVVGGEADGLRQLTREHCDELVSIPMRGSVASLNVSVATGILLFEAVRQRLAQAPAPD